MRLGENARPQLLLFEKGTLLCKHVVDGHKQAMAFTEAENHIPEHASGNREDYSTAGPRDEKAKSKPGVERVVSVGRDHPAGLVLHGQPRGSTGALT